MRTHWGLVGSRRSPWLCFVPGPIIWLLLYFGILHNGGRFLYEERFGLMQALDPNAVAQQFWPSLMTLHTQPPLLNGLYALTDGPDAPRTLGLIYAVASMITILMVIHTVRLVGLAAPWAAVAGVMYAMLPGTVLYSLFPYSTTVVALFMIACIWGVALSRLRPGFGIVVSGLAATGLFLTRASFAWAFALAWLVALGFLLRRLGPLRREAGAIGVLATCAVVIVVLQAHYLTAFGTPTLSSWSGQNLYGAVSELGLSPEAKAALAAESPCFAELVAVGAWQPASAYPVCLGESGTPISGSIALDETDKRSPGVGINHNSGELLLLSERWSALSRAALMQEPAAEWRLIAGSDGRDGSLALFLGRSDIYYETLDLQKTFAPWMWSALGAWSWIFPKLAWAILLLALLRAAVDRAARRRVPTAFWFASGLLIFHAAVSVAAEYGENQRFRAEADPVLVVAALLAFVSLLDWRRGAVPSACAEDRRSYDDDTLPSGAVGVWGLPGT